MMVLNPFEKEFHKVINQDPRSTEVIQLGLHMPSLDTSNAHPSSFSRDPNLQAIESPSPQSTQQPAPTSRWKRQAWARGPSSTSLSLTETKRHHLDLIHEISHTPWCKLSCVDTNKQYIINNHGICRGCEITSSWIMKIILSWDCQKLENPQTVWELHHLVRAKCPNIVLFIEKKCKKTIINALKWKLGLLFGSQAQKESLALFWKEERHVELVHYPHYYIHVKVSMQGGLRVGGLRVSVVSQNSKKTRLMGFFVMYTSRHQEFMVCYRWFQRNYYARWEIWREEPTFNTNWAILKSIGDHWLTCLGWKGSKFIHSNRHTDESFTKEWLDRAQANKD